MSIEDNKALIRRYIQAVDDDQTSDWGIQGIDLSTSVEEVLGNLQAE